MLNKKINEDIVVEEGILSIKGTKLTRFHLDKAFPLGANGVAFAGMHETLRVPRVVKVWLTLRSGDERDKLKQGVAEAYTMATAHPDWVAAVHDADTVNGYFLAAMELIDGVTLKDLLYNVTDKTHLGGWQGYI